MKLPLFVHTDPRKTKRSAVVRVPNGSFQVENNLKDSVIDLVVDGDRFLVESSGLEGYHPLILSVRVAAKVYAEVMKSGTEPHISLALVSQ